MAEEHPFSQVIRTVGRGPSRSRPLTREEAQAAMTDILNGQVRPEQLGAFLLVLRYRGETAAELAGFVDAARAHFRFDAPPGAADLDWPSYADRHRQQPWFLLSALLLAANGIKVVIHGLVGASAGLAPTRPVLERFGIAPAQSIAATNAALRTHGIAYLGLEEFCPGLQRLIDLRGVLGVRTAVNSAARALNPFLAPHQMQGVFHPPYRALQQETALLLGQPNAIIFKGGGGEAQRNPLKPCRAALIRDGSASDQEWPALLPDADYNWRTEPLEPELPEALWRGDTAAPAPEAAIVGTAAMALFLMRRAPSIEAAQAAAAAMWQSRPRTRFLAAA